MRRFVASRIVALIIQGVPGVYLHSLIGTRNDIEAVMSSHASRDINRRVIDEKLINQALKDPLSKVSRISRELGRLLNIRTGERAFHPSSDQKILDLAPQIFSVLRTTPERDRKVLAMVNVSSKPVKLDIPLAELGLDHEFWFDLVSEMEWAADEGVLHLSFLPYDVIWLTPGQAPA